MHMLLSFTPGKLAENEKHIIEFFGLPGKLSLPVSSFAIETDGITDTVCVMSGRPSSAFLLLYLSQMKSGKYSEHPFEITEEMRQLTKDYFGPSLCLEAASDPETRYTVIRSLITGKKVIVTLHLRH